MPANKKLKTVATDNQRKITDFIFKSETSHSIEGPEESVADKNIEDDEKSDKKAPEKQDFQPRWLQSHHWLCYEGSKQNVLHPLHSNRGQ